MPKRTIGERFKRADRVQNVPSLPYSSIGSRAATTVALLVYTAAFSWSYSAWVSVVWGYQGAKFIAPSVESLVTIFLLAPIPSFFVPPTLKRPTQIMYWIIYLTVYIPSICAPTFMGLSSANSIFLLSVVLSTGMVVIGLCYRFPLIRINTRKLAPEVLSALFIGLWVACHGILLVVYHGHLRLVGLKEVYDVRLAARQITAANPVSGYAAALAGDALNPLLMAFGLATRRKWLFVAGILGQTLIYSTAAMRSIIISPLVVFGAYLLFKKHPFSAVTRLSLGLAAACVFLTATAAKAIGGIGFSLASIVLYRMLAIPGVEMGEYYDFFHHFPKTFYSHVTGINWFITYPYKLSIGREVSAQYLGNSVANANASFFAMDGIAALGLPGILVASFLCALVFLTIDSCATDLKAEFVAAALAYTSISLANSSLFTTLLGDGLFLLMVLFLYTPDHILEPSAIPTGYNTDMEKQCTLSNCTPYS